MPFDLAVEPEWQVLNILVIEPPACMPFSQLNSCWAYSTFILWEKSYTSMKSVGILSVAEHICCLLEEPTESLKKSSLICHCTCGKAWPQRRARNIPNMQHGKMFY